MFSLGQCYYHGEGIAVDMVEAFKWYKRAAEAGHVKAMFSLGQCYYHGDGVAVEKIEAFKWCKRAAEAGYKISKQGDLE